ncbi:MAG: ATP-dependent sacrificial sulfur transferase LarE [Eubacteriales bacterium]|nr:ATP-dependent sacrificial sulfur transferase LarE [Eubacteriales bacterium]
MREQVLGRINELTKENVFVAFSGGADSSLILKLSCDAAKLNNTKVYAVMLNTRLHPKGDLENAKKISEETGAQFIVVDIDELEDTQIKNNPKDRCYLCKKAMFKRLQEKAGEFGITTILEGTNRDDLKMYRPGIRALKELGIISPLAEAQITKIEVRKWLCELGISTAQRASAPCLATRLPYGDRIDYELLSRIDKGEAYLRELGFYNVRLRVHKNIARIEVDRSDIHKLVDYACEITDVLKKLGFVYITIDLEGFRSGSMDIE